VPISISAGPSYVVTIPAAGAILGAMANESEPVRHVEHYATGVVKMAGFHLDGEMHGAWEWYRTDGSLMRTGEFDRGKQVGAWRTFDRSGRMVKETDFTKRP
jgi:antitoxin component YwqK of YwqJK toxin-antitoxin module